MVPKRLLKHIVKCRFKNVVEDQPLDLSPLKRRAEALSSHSERGRSDDASEVDPNNQRISKSNVRNDSLTERRILYPFDKVSDTNVSDEGYQSEYETGDTVEETQQRRNIKDSLELELRRRDELDLCNEKDDVPFLNKFEEFMVTITGGRDVGTVGEYTNLVKSYFLPTYHESYSPFSALWLIDCETKKYFTINGNDLVNVLPEEPVYLTTQMFEAVMKKAPSANTKKKLLAAIKKIQEFQELEISKTTGTMGLEPLQKVQAYRRMLDVYITATAQWRNVWDGVRKNQENNKRIKEHEHPNKDLETLEAYQKWLEGDPRESKLKILIYYATNKKAKIPSSKIMTNIAIGIMEEIIAACGCRPVVTRRFNMRAWSDINPGFNPNIVSEDDQVVRESHNGDNIYMR